MLNNIDKLIKKSGLTVTEVAKRSGISRDYLNKLKSESSTKRLNEDIMRRLANVLECHPSKLIEETVKAQYFGKVGAGWGIMPIYDMPRIRVREHSHSQPDDPVEFVDAPPDAPHGMGCIDIDGNSMEPYLKTGDRVFFLRRTKDFESLLNKPCIVWLRDGRFAVKIPRRSAAMGKYDLDSYNAEIVKNCELEWVAKIKYREDK